MRLDLKNVHVVAGTAAVRARLAIQRFLFDTKAVSTVEYALIVVAVVAIIGVAAGTLTDAFDGLFNDFQNEIQGTLNNVT